MKSRGFTLAEVLLSVALTATTLLGLVSLLAEGLQSVGTSADTTLRTQIARSLLTQIQSSEWQLGTGYVPSSGLAADQFFYFDDQGMPVQDSGSPRAQYTARVTWGTSGVALPGSLTHLQIATPGNPFARPFSIQIAVGSAKDSRVFEDPDKAHLFHTLHSVHTTRMPILTSTL